MKRLYILILLLLTSGGLAAQVTNRDYFEPYNYPDKYESDKLNKNLNLLFSLPIGGHFYNFSLYADAKRIKLTEFMNINVGLGITGGISDTKTDLYLLSGQKAYNQQTVYFVKGLLGGGITFRLLNPLNLSVRTGVAGGLEYYRSSEVRPLQSGSSWDKVKYSQVTPYYFRLGYFYNITVFYKLKKIALGLSHGCYFLATGPEMMNSLGFVFPIGN